MNHPNSNSHAPEIYRTTLILLGFIGHQHTSHIGPFRLQRLISFMRAGYPWPISLVPVTRRCSEFRLRSVSQQLRKGELHHALCLCAYQSSASTSCLCLFNRRQMCGRAHSLVVTIRRGVLSCSGPPNDRGDLRFPFWPGNLLAVRRRWI